MAPRGRIWGLILGLAAVHWGYRPGFVCDFEDPGMCGWVDMSAGSEYSWEKRQRGERLPDSGPSSDYTTGTSAGWFMGVTSVSSDQHSLAMLMSPLMHQSALTCQLRLRYFMWDSGHTGLDGEALWGSVHWDNGEDAVVWRPNLSSFRGWREDTIYLGRIPRAFRIHLHSRRTRGRRGDIAIDQLEFLNCGLPAPGPCVEGSLKCGRGNCVEPHQICDGSDDCGDGTDEKNCQEKGYWGCDFEDGLCGWDLRTFSTLKWSLTNQNNLSLSSSDPRTGPGRDHTTNIASGSFLYLTKTDRMTHDWSHFQSPVLEATNSTHPCQMVLYTHQFGPQAGGLSVLVVDREMYPVWERGGQLGDVWVKAEVNFVINTTFQIVLVGAIRDKEFGGIAVDSIRMSPGCQISNDSSPVVTYPEPPFHRCTSSEKMCDFHSDCADNADEAVCGDFSFAQGITGWTDSSVGNQGWARGIQEGPSQGGYLYVTAYPGQQVTEAQTRTPLLGPSGPACSLELSYNLSGNSTHIGELSISVIDGKSGIRSPLWEFAGQTEGAWLKAEVYIGARNNRFQLELGAFARYEQADIAVRDVHYLNCHKGHLPSTSPDLFCNFETNDCNWYQDQTDNFDWTLLNGMDHTTGKGRSLVVDMWDPSLRGLSGRLLSYPYDHLYTEYCLHFFYRLYGPQPGSLNVKLLSGDSEVLLWTRSGAHGNQWHEGQVPIPHQHIKFQVVFEAIRSGFDGQVGIDDVSVLSRPCSAPLACSFEGQNCGYTLSGSSPWVHQNGISGGISPAPESDHTLETDLGYYMITDSSARFLPAGDVTTLTSLLRNSAPHMECVQFWYYMGGEKPGTLYVYVKQRDGKRTKIFSRSLQQMRGWHYGNGNISMSQAWQLEFEVEGAGSKQAFIAIDDIVISSYSCPPPETKCTLESGLCGWLNTQANDQLDWEVSSAAEERHYSTPPFDRTLQSVRGHFLLLPSSLRDTVGQEAWLLSPHLPPTLGTCLRFWVHKDDGGLKVVRMVGNTQELLLSVGEVSEVWRKFETNITSKEAYQIVFQGVKGKFGSLALDDIQYTPGVNCAGQNTDPKPMPPGDDSGGLAASVIVTLLLLVTLAGLLAFYLYWRKNLEPAPKLAQPSASCGISNQAYDPSIGDHVVLPPMSRKPEDSPADLANTEEREIV